MNISILGYENTALLLQQSGIGRYIRCVLFFLFLIFGCYYVIFFNEFIVDTFRMANASENIPVEKEESNNSKTETTASEEAKKAVKTGDDSTVELMAMMTGLSLLAGTVVLSKKYY